MAKQERKKSVHSFQFVSGFFFGWECYSIWSRTKLINWRLRFSSPFLQVNKLCKKYHHSISAYGKFLNFFAPRYQVQFLQLYNNLIQSKTTAGLALCSLFAKSWCTFSHHYFVKKTSWYSFLHRTIRRSRRYSSSLLMTFVVTSARVGQILMIFQPFFHFIFRYYASPPFSLILEDMVIFSVAKLRNLMTEISHERYCQQGYFAFRELPLRFYNEKRCR